MWRFRTFEEESDDLFIARSDVLFLASKLSKKKTMFWMRFTLKHRNEHELLVSWQNGIRLSGELRSRFGFF
jgi:hypothetical protein